MAEGSRSVPSWLLPVGLGVLVITLVSIAMLRGPVELDPDSPEGTVQEYLRAMDEERWDDAVAVIQEDWRGQCDGSDLSITAPGDFSAQLGIQQGWSTSTGGAPPGADFPPPDTTVDVTITHHDAGGLGGSWDEPVTFELADLDDFWWIVGDPWPWFVWNCRGDL